MQGADLIARVTAQTCRQSGLSVVYTELLDFDGAEIYFTPAGSLSGRSYREVLSSFEDSAVIGLMHGDGEVQINPVMETVLRTDDQIIAISEDDDTVVPSTTAPRAPSSCTVASGTGPRSASARAAAMRRAVVAAVPDGASALFGWCSSTISADG